MRFPGGNFAEALPGARDYRQRYREKYERTTGEKMPDKIGVHHSIPRDYSDILWDELGINVHDDRWLRGVDKEIDKKLRDAWQSFKDEYENRSPTAREVIEKARELDRRYNLR